MEKKLLGSQLLKNINKQIINQNFGDKNQKKKLVANLAKRKVGLILNAEKEKKQQFDNFAWMPKIIENLPNLDGRKKFTN